MPKVKPRRAGLRHRIGAIDARMLFFVGLIVSASGAISPPVALAAGILYGLCFAHPMRADSTKLAKTLLQLSVIALGFGMNLTQVLKVGRSGFAYTAVSIVCSLGAGLLLGKALSVKNKASFLIAAGTAICGGSAIAAVAPVLDAQEDEISVAMATVFVLNAVALFVFPVVGVALHLSQTQFGLWAALAIHDTSSVVGASAKYGSEALMIGTTVKLARALWIVPVTVAVALVVRSRAEAQAKSAGRAMQIPWFIVLFCVASVLQTYVPAPAHLYENIARLGRTGLTATLFLIGTGLTRATLRKVGFRPFVQGVVLWVLVGTISLWAIYRGVIGL